MQDELKEELSHFVAYLDMCQNKGYKPHSDFRPALLRTASQVSNHNDRSGMALIRMMISFDDDSAEEYSSARQVILEELKV